MLQVDQALFEGNVDGIVAITHENERPFLGLAGLLDWRLKGALSFFVRSGAITGRSGEIAYLPYPHHERLLHLFFLGQGMNATPGTRTPPSKEHLVGLQARFKSLGFQRSVGFSISDFGKINRDVFEREWKGPTPCLFQ